ncbi:MAG: MerR family transcriptional regulator [Bacilli bacterium]
MYKIGDFSKKTKASIRTLRYYDKIDLLKPDSIDIFTGYRYYSEQKIDEYNLIMDLKDSGYSLDEIKKDWNNFNSTKMDLKKIQLLDEVKNINDKIKKLDFLKSHITDGKIVVKNSDVKTLISLPKKLVVGDYNQYIIKHDRNTEIAKSIKSKNAIYYILYLDNEVIDDFVIIPKLNNYLTTLKKSTFENESVMNFIFNNLNYECITMSFKNEIKEYDFKLIEEQKNMYIKCLKEK